MDSWKEDLILEISCSNNWDNVDNGMSTLA